MKKSLLIFLTILSSLSALATEEGRFCYFYYYETAQTERAFCNSIDFERANDEGELVYSYESIDYSIGCLLTERYGEKFELEIDENACLEGVDEGWFVLGTL